MIKGDRPGIVWLITFVSSRSGHALWVVLVSVVTRAVIVVCIAWLCSVEVKLQHTPCAAGCMNVSVYATAGS